MDESSNLFSLETAAIKTALSSATIRKLIKTGKLPAIRLSRNILRIRECDLEAFIRSKEVATAK